ncbi:four-carbon acid sugar kinase family protein [Oscillospiraceae bacterium MB08-C2-2]|nr:four-carbon acid sugar kinase family protein [Oscillospiraceae bacterium MB08-C2-2]
MIKLLIIADDFTGALDTGIQFVKHGVKTKVLATPTYSIPNEKQQDTQVFVINAETRHLKADQAYDVVFRVVQAAHQAGIPHIYIKTDSALRGNVGSSLAAAMAGAQAEQIIFVPAFPQIGRCTRDGVHYINDIPVHQSVFGQDLFEPVTCSDVREIIALQSPVPVVLHPENQPVNPHAQPGIQLYDACSEARMQEIGDGLDEKQLHLSAGCAGFAAILLGLFGLEGAKQPLPELNPVLMVVCGSINPITTKQLEYAAEQGFHRLTLTAAQKFTSRWGESAECAQLLQNFYPGKNRLILDINGPLETHSVETAAFVKDLDVEQVRVMVATNLGSLVKQLLDQGFDGTLMLTGGDTLLGATKALGVQELSPIGEIYQGVILSSFTYKEQTFHLISKSGGFGEKDILPKLAAFVAGTSQRQQGE